MAKHRVYVLRTFYTIASLLRSTRGRVGPLSGIGDRPEVTERVECVEGMCLPSRHFFQCGPYRAAIVFTLFAMGKRDDWGGGQSLMHVRLPITRDSQWPER